MIRFVCPRCDKGLRAEDSKAGSRAKCPSCGHSFPIPTPEPEPAPPEDTEPRDADTEQPAPRRRRRKFRPKATGSDRGRSYVLAIVGIVLAMHLLGLIRYVATLNAFEASQKQLEETQRQTRERLQALSKDLPKDFDAKLEEQLKRVEVSRGSRLWGTLGGLVMLLGRFAIDAVLLYFLYLRHDWARIVLGVLFVLWSLFGLQAIVFGGLGLLSLFSTGRAIIYALEMFVGLGVSIGLAVALLKSEEIAAYTAGK